MKRLPTCKEDLKPLSEYKETKDSYVSDIFFDPSEDDRIFEGCPPFLVLSTDTLENEFYEIPQKIADYAVWHRGWTNAGRKKAVEDGVRMYKAKLREFLGIKDQD